MRNRAAAIGEHKYKKGEIPMNGWVGQILEVNLGDGKISTQPTASYVDHYLGGRGIGVRLVFDRLKPGTDALAPENPLIFSMGPLTGTAMPSSGRTDITALSPLSNLRAKSNFGGYWGPEAKYAGFVTCEPWSGFTGAVWNLDMKVFWEAVLLSRKLGIDPTEACACIGLLMELYHEGIISEKDTDGIPMERGGREAILETIRKIGLREGYGDLLAEGQRAFAEKIGPSAVEKLDLVKGLAPHPYEFRAYRGSALMQAVGHRGDPLPLRGSLIEFEWHNAPEWFQELTKGQFGCEEAAIPSEYRGKAQSAVISEHNDRVVDSLGICTWPYSLFIFHNIEKATRFFNLVTGKDWSMEELLRIGERIRNLERMFDVRQGLNRDMDTLPNKFFEKPLTKGKYKGAVLDREKFELMKDEYYHQRGWDSKTGIPTREKLWELGLDDATADLPAEA
jgi:aldehyde:ferredoxin oxidoreductase